VTKTLPYRKGSVLIDSGSCKHLHVICNDPVHHPALGCYTVLAVNITSVNPALEYDASCVLQAGEHPFIKHDSYVYYRKADLFNADKMEQAINDGEFQIHHDFTDATFAKILKGFEISPEVSYKIQRFYEKHCKS